MSENAPNKSEGGWQPNLPPWSNVVVQPDDAEIGWIGRLQEYAMPIPPVATAIRELITRFEICHFKAERHVWKIIEAIGQMRLDFAPATIGKAHPRSGESAWRGDQTGRSRQGQEFIWALQMWLENAARADNRRVAPVLLEEVTCTLGERAASKKLLVEALLNRLLLRADRQPLPPELSSFWEPIERSDICHYAFPSNLRLMIEGIGRLEPPAEFPGCGSCDEAHRRMALEHFRALCGWLREQANDLETQLGDRVPIRKWLVASFAKTLKEHAGLQERLPNEKARE